MLSQIYTHPSTSLVLEFLGHAEGWRITVTAESLDGQVVIAVADTGVGIPDAYLRRIFEPFVQPVA